MGNWVTPGALDVISSIILFAPARSEPRGSQWSMILVAPNPAFIIVFVWPVIDVIGSDSKTPTPVILQQNRGVYGSSVIISDPKAFVSP